MTTAREPAIWFPTVRCGTGTDIFTKTLVQGLHQLGIRTEIVWLPHRAEYAPWTVPIPKPPTWANVAHINTWLHPRFIPHNLPIVATLHHSIHDPTLTPYKGWLRAAYHRYWIRRLERTTMRRAKVVVAVSQFAANITRQHVLNRPIQIIYNGVDIQRFHPPTKRQTQHPFRLLYIGSWMARKGVDLLAPIMRELGEDFTLHFTGGPVAQKNQRDVPSNMHDLGRLDLHGVVSAMQHADALLFPSRSEGMPLTILEAMACGLPVICTRGSSLTEVVQEGETGYLCPRDDVLAFAQAARRLANDGPLRSKMREAARQRVEAEFSSSNMIESYIRQYEQLTTPRERAQGTVLP